MYRIASAELISAENIAASPRAPIMEGSPESNTNNKASSLSVRDGL